MRGLKPLLLTLALAAVPAGLLGGGGAAARFTTPDETGTVFTVINYRRDAGRAQVTTTTFSWRGTERRLSVRPPYRRCTEEAAAGFVLKLRHSQPGPMSLALSTDGTIVRGPYQGSPPLELLNDCYKLVL
jgi:hypothetical protein